MKKMKELLADKRIEFDINLYQSYIKDLYSTINTGRDFADSYGGLHRNIFLWSKSIEANSNDQSKFILPISCLFSLATNMDINILEALIKRFPGICPYCLERQCVCYRTNKKPQKSMSIYEVEMEIFYKWEEIKNSHVDINLDSAVKLISNIYPHNEVIWRVAGYQHHILKIHEDMAEMHEAYGNLLEDKKAQNAVMDEVAEVFAGILSAWAIRYPNQSMDSAFIECFLNDCPVCRKAPCECGLSESII